MSTLESIRHDARMSPIWGREHLDAMQSNYDEALEIIAQLKAHAKATLNERDIESVDALCANIMEDTWEYRLGEAKENME